MIYMIQTTLSIKRLNRAAVGILLLTGNVYAQRLNVVPEQVSLASQPGSSSAIATVTLFSTTPDVPFKASVRYLGSTTGWLSVSPIEGNAPSTLLISADSSSLSTGIYRGQVAIAAGSLGTVVNVLFTVGSSLALGPLAVGRSSLTFVGQFDIGVLPTQTLSVTSTPGAANPVQFSAFASSAGNWLSVSPVVTTTPATLEIVAIQAGLTAGIHSGTITLVPAGGEPTVVPVTLSATGGDISPELSLSQSAVTINHQLGTLTPPVQSVRVDIRNRAAGEFTASTATSWLRLATAFDPIPSKTVTSNVHSDFRILMDPTGLSAGTYVGVINVASPGLATKELPVSLNISATPVLNTDPSYLTLEDVSNSERRIIVMSSGSTDLPITVEVSPARSWLSVTPMLITMRGSLAELVIRANGGGLPAGAYTGVVTITARESDTAIRIPVQFDVSGLSIVGLLKSSVTSVELNGVVGLSNPSQTIEINVDTGENPTTASTHNFTVAALSTGGWLTVSPISAAAPAKLTLTAKLEALAGAGTYEGSVLVTSLVTGNEFTIPVTLKISEQAILAEPASLSFLQQQWGVSPPSQTIQLAANLPSTFSVTDTPTWIRVSPSNGLTPSTLTVWADLTLLSPGPKNGRILIAGARNQLSIPVSAVILEPPRLTATPEVLTFTHQLGHPDLALQTISIGSTSAPVTFTASAATSSGVGWLNVFPLSGSTPSTITVKVSPALLVPGRHTGTVPVVGSNTLAAPRMVDVTVNVSTSSVSLEGILHAAKLAPTVIAPGQIITIIGSGLGPVTGIEAKPSAAGAIEATSATPVSILMAHWAPLLFVRNDQINAIVPYDLSGRASAQVQVQVGTSFSMPIEVRVVETAPGIFTAGNSGRGQAAVLNDDMTPNSPVNPASRGSIITVFGTGEGQTDPPGQNGRVIFTDLRRPILPVTATIGGHAAAVTYMGSAATHWYGCVPSQSPSPRRDRDWLCYARNTNWRSINPTRCHCRCSLKGCLKSLSRYGFLRCR